MACSRCLAPWQVSFQVVSEQIVRHQMRSNAVFPVLKAGSLAQFLANKQDFLSGKADPLLLEASPVRRCSRRQSVVLAAKKKGGPVNKAAAAKKEKEAAQASANAVLNAAPYTDPDVFMHSLLLIDSYQRATGKPLFTGLDLTDSGRALFEAPFVCVSHDGEEDPVFDYGNKAALDLFEMTWDGFTKLPSRNSAAPDTTEQETRNKLLAEAQEKGAVELVDEQRFTSTGKPFTIKKGVLWTITDLEGDRLGQAAIFSDIEFLDSASSSDEQTATTEQSQPSNKQEGDL